MLTFCVSRECYFDVGAEFYGPDGIYPFAGHECARAFALISTDVADCNADLTVCRQRVLQAILLPLLLPVGLAIEVVEALTLNFMPCCIAGLGSNGAGQPARLGSKVQFQVPHRWVHCLTCYSYM